MAPNDPIPADEPAAEKPQVSPQRDEEIRRAAALGQKRSEREKQIKQNIKDNRKAEEKRAREGVKIVEAKKEKAKEHVGEYRVANKQRAKELADEKLRKDKEAARQADISKKAKAEQKKKLQYMGDLREMGRLKQAAEHREVVLTADEERDRKAANFEFRTKILEADRLETLAKEAADRDVRAQKVILENDMRNKLYQAETWHRMKVAELDAEVHRQTAQISRISDPGQQRQEAMAAQGLIRGKRKKIDEEYREKQDAITQEIDRRKNEIETHYYAARAKAESDRRTAGTNADRELARRNEDITLTFKRRRKGEEE